MKINRAGKEIPPFKLERASLKTSNYTDGSVTADKLASDAVTTAKIKDAAVTATKIASGATSTLTYSNTEVFSGTAPTSWTDLDLSGTVGSNTALVLLKINSTDDLNAVSVRTDGDTDEFYSDVNVDEVAYGCALGHHDAGIHLVLMVTTSSSGVIEWCCELAQDETTVDVISYIA